MSIKDLSAKFDMPERMVYHKIRTTPSIHTKKEGRAKLVNVADFAKACDKPLQPLQITAQGEPKNESTTVIADLKNSNTELQYKIQKLSTQNDVLENRNVSLVSDVNKYSLAVKQENEKKERWIKKYDTLQLKTESYMKRYYLLLWLCITLIFVLLNQYLPKILENYFLSGN